MARDFKDVNQDYICDEDMFTEEDRRVNLTKWIIQNRLDLVDRTIILLYADCQSYRKLGKRLHLSHTTIATQVHRIRDFIRSEYERLKDDEHIL